MSRLAVSDPGIPARWPFEAFASYVKPLIDGFGEPSYNSMKPRRFDDLLADTYKVHRRPLIACAMDLGHD